jgi:hypothetical protein
MPLCLRYRKRKGKDDNKERKIATAGRLNKAKVSSSGEVPDAF